MLRAMDTKLVHTLSKPFLTIPPFAMAILLLTILALTAMLLWIGKGRHWGYAPASLLSLIFVIPIIMMLVGFI